LSRAVFHPTASREFNEAIRHYEQEQQGLGGASSKRFSRWSLSSPGTPKPRHGTGESYAASWWRGFPTSYYIGGYPAEYGSPSWRTRIAGRDMAAALK
jgi:hypothetical protein